MADIEMKDASKEEVKKEETTVVEEPQDHYYGKSYECTRLVANPLPICCQQNLRSLSCCSRRPLLTVTSRWLPH